MFRDLYRYDWPIYYDFSKQPEFARSVIGDASSGTYVYYFAWWLPAAAFMKITRCPEIIGHLALFVWAVLELFLTFYLLVRYIGKYSYWILSAMILFAGLDMIMYVICNMKFPDGIHIEWWVRYFQYSANTTQLYWVFNQSVPVWLIIGLLLQVNSSRSSPALCSLSFAYSPFATIGMVPIAIASVFNSGGGQGRTFWRKIKEAVSIENITVPLIMLIIFGSFYLQNKSSLGKSGIIFQVYPELRTFTLLILFYLVEFGIYFFAMGKDAMRYRFYMITLSELLLIPLFFAGANNDFCMRASIPALMLLMVIMLQYIHDDNFGAEKKKRRKAVMALLIVGYLTSAAEIQRNVKNTLLSSQNDYLRESVYSFGEMRTEDEGQIRLNLKQYVPTEYQNTFFYKYIAERGYRQTQ